MSEKNIIAVIPARGGSKRIPGKNIAPLDGLPLLAHSIRQAKNSQYIKEVFVSTEDMQIFEVAAQYGAQVIQRPFELAGDKASSESAVLHVLDQLKSQGRPDPDLVVFLQGTSPLREKDDLDKAIEKFLAEGGDSLFSACRSFDNIWSVKDGQPYSLTYDYKNRRMEQDIKERFLENGSFYVFKPEILRRENNRLGGKIIIYEMDPWNSFQVDRPDDLEFMEWLIKRKHQSSGPTN